MGDEEKDDNDDISKMFFDKKDILSSDEELAFYIYKFNLDRDTIESMPAFEEKTRVLFGKEK